MAGNIRLGGLFNTYIKDNGAFVQENGYYKDSTGSMSTLWSPDVRKYIFCVESKGATISDSVVSALTTFMADIAPIRSSIKHLWMPCSDNFLGAPCAIINDIGDRSMTVLGTFTSGDYSLAGGIQYNVGGTGYGAFGFDTGISEAEWSSTYPGVYGDGIYNFSFHTGVLHAGTGTGEEKLIGANGVNEYGISITQADWFLAQFHKNATIYQTGTDRRPYDGKVLGASQTTGFDNGRSFKHYIDGVQVKSSSQYNFAHVARNANFYYGAEDTGGAYALTARVGMSAICTRIDNPALTTVLPNAYHKFNTAIGRS